MWLTSDYSLSRHRLDLILTIPSPVLASLMWWLDSDLVLSGVPFATLQLMMTLHQIRGGGPTLATSRSKVSGRRDLSRHINVKELRAIHLASKVFLLQLSGKSVQVLTNTTVAVFYVNKQGGACSRIIFQEVLRLWEFGVKQSIHLEASHLSEVWNGLAYHLSRSFSSHHKWSLHLEVAGLIFQRWVTPQVDLFTTAESRKCHWFCLRLGQGKGSLSDAFLLSRKNNMLDTFPSDSPDSQGPPEDQRRQGKSYCNCSSMATSTLVLHASRSCSGSPVDAPTQVGPNLTRLRTASSSKACLPAPDSMAASGQEGLLGTNPTGLAR
ncbi:uncharacterized protein LOC119566638 [Chelonia mydas]|uniref:uncharacterized protein LOC119566638 n=1 Tax=Chelonia mydas TaxID=8469 RepID=UPI001CA9A817|nr:uncharacterized protein LOC119566638 [Chelonia mydas]XP_043402629.1 uncharacterized protein LOC119566638 [Chelonia mydas]XP_043402630.1 uncharacterized protein LOC119566638 [Chelonia mydas]